MSLEAKNPKSLFDRIAFIAVITLLGLLGMLAFFYITGAANISYSMQEKSARVLNGINAKMMAGEDPQPVLLLFSQVGPALAKGDAAGANLLLERALGQLGPYGNIDPATVKPQALPLYTAAEQSADLFGIPQKVQILGYRGGARQPFVTYDSNILFFVNDDAPGVDNNIYSATGRDDGKGLLFEYAGLLRGANSPEAESAPSLDENGRFFFSSERDYALDFSSLYLARFTQTGVTDVNPVSGELPQGEPGWILTDPEINPPGNMLYFAHAQILFGQNVPLHSDLALAYYKDGAYMMHPYASEIFANINTAALEYAPSVNATGTEIYFTRASRSQDAQGSDINSWRIMMAQRQSVNEPFGVPVVIASVTGFVEAPHISADGQRLYFHKNENGKSEIYMAQRLP